MSRPHSKRCTTVFVRALNHARAVMKQPKYRLPARFASLTAQDQLLVLSNLDRRLYGRTPITGLNPRLDASAHRGARQNRDPDFVGRINGAQLEAGGSNWAGGGSPMGSPLFAYYLWMYDDGPGSGNIDCQHKGDPGCWGHRDNTLFQAPAHAQAEMGVGFAKPNGSFSWTELYEAFPASATIPCLPSVIGLSRHSGPTSGGTLVVHGFGFVQVRAVKVLGQRAKITKRSATALTIHVPRHPAGAGFVVVRTAVGSSARTYAAAYKYVA
jgi:hypothetical protein